MADSKIILQIRKLKQQLNDAENKFNDDGRTLSLNARRTHIQIDQMHMAYDIIDEATRILVEFYVSCDHILETLDSKCCGLISDQTKAGDVRAVIEFIQELIDTIENTQIQFDVSLNSTKLGRIDQKAITSVKARKILKRWEHYYQEMPGYEKDQELLEKEARKKSELVNDQRSMIEQQKQTNAELQARAQELTEKHLEKAEQFRKALQNEIEAFAAALNDGQKEKAQSLRLQLEQTNRALTQTGLFAFGEKKYLKYQIQTLTADLAAAEDLRVVERRVADKKKLAEEAVNAYREKIRSHCKGFLITEMRKVSIPSDKKLPPLRQCSPEEADVVRYIMSYHGREIPLDYIQTGVFSSQYTNQQIGAILMRLMDKGYIVRTEKDRKYHYKTIDQPTVESFEVLTWNQAEADKACPQMPDVKTALGL